VHPDAGDAPGERGTGLAGAEPRRKSALGPLVNYHVLLPYYIVARLFDTAVLVIGMGVRHGRSVGLRDDPPEGRRTVTSPPDDNELRGPARLSPPRVPVVRLVAECSTSRARVWRRTAT
jgi:hypothetical protein